jgi:hypothetical protein
MFNRRPLAWAACALSLLGGTAHAQSITTPGGGRAPVEVTPFVSAASGDATGVGAAIRWPLVSRIRLGIEVDTEFRSGETRGINSSVNAVFELPVFRRVRPYVVGGAGVERYAALQYLAQFGSFMRPTTGPYWNLGGGVRVPINERWGFRVDVRYSDGFDDLAPDRLRVSWGATVGLGKSGH